LKESTDNLAKTSIYAPVSGTVSKLNKRKGERVVGTAQMEGTEILRLANLLEMEVLVDVNENDILRVHEGDTAYVEVDAHDNRKFKGIVTEVANSANTLGLSTDQVTNFQVKIRILRESYQDLLDPEHPERYPFLPGMYSNQACTECSHSSDSIGYHTNRYKYSGKRKRIELWQRRSAGRRNIYRRCG
jgi:HlyD family secretion protein